MPQPALYFPKPLPTSKPTTWQQVQLKSYFPNPLLDATLRGLQPRMKMIARFAIAVMTQPALVRREYL
jgi:hypothetical protein